LNWPEKPIRLIVPAVTGAPSDQVMRIVADRVATGLARPVIIENRPGAGGIIGNRALAASPADGYTFGATGLIQFIVAPALVAELPFDIERHFAPVALVVWSYSLLAVPDGSRLRSVADIVASAQVRPGMLRFATAGNATPPHLAGELLKQAAGIHLTHIPYSSAPAAAIAVLAGDVEIVIGPPSVLGPHLRSGRLRPLATSAPRRIEALPELPTFTELGFPGVALRDGIAMVAPAGTPAPVIERMNAEILSAIGEPEVRQRLEAIGMEMAGVGPVEFGVFLRDERRRLEKLIREARIRAD
jgi:tripartite-type tricarboxylate transporter receptor subunit TctC